MAKRPPGMDRAEWESERKRVWARRNWVFNILMFCAIVALYVRNCT